nr:uncharacterized protein LOC129165157 [Nothobranchius furzeri]
MLAAVILFLFFQTMLFKVQYIGKKRYIKLNGASYSTFLSQAKEKFGIQDDKRMYLVDETGTEVDEDVFTDVLEEKSDIIWTLVDASSVEESSVQSSCTDTLSLSSFSSDSELSVLSPKRRRIDETTMMSPRRDQNDNASFQAKEVTFSIHLNNLNLFDLILCEFVYKWRLLLIGRLSHAHLLLYHGSPEEQKNECKSMGLKPQFSNSACYVPGISHMMSVNFKDAF